MKEEHAAEGATGSPGAPSHETSLEDGEVTVGAETLQAQVQELTQRTEQLLANWQRAQADLTNYRKQVEREREELITRTAAALMTDLLPILDDFDRALSTVADQLRTYTWIDGVWLVSRKLETILTAYGLEEVKAEGQSFDPHLHQAIAEVDGAADKVLEVVQKGYKLQQRLLRPALVTVGRQTGSPASGEDPESPEEEEIEKEPPASTS